MMRETTTGSSRGRIRAVARFRPLATGEPRDLLVEALGDLEQVTGFSPHGEAGAIRVALSRESFPIYIETARAVSESGIYGERDRWRSCAERPFVTAETARAGDEVLAVIDDENDLLFETEEPLDFGLASRITDEFLSLYRAAFDRLSATSGVVGFCPALSASFSRVLLIRSASPAQALEELFRFHYGGPPEETIAALDAAYAGCAEVAHLIRSTLETISPADLRAAFVIHGAELSDVPEGVELRFCDSLGSVETPDGPRAQNSADTLIEVLREIAR